MNKKTTKTHLWTSCTVVHSKLFTLHLAQQQTTIACNKKKFGIILEPFAKHWEQSATQSSKLSKTYKTLLHFKRWFTREPFQFRTSIAEACKLSKSHQEPEWFFLNLNSNLLFGFKISTNKSHLLSAPLQALTGDFGHFLLWADQLSPDAKKMFFFFVFVVVDC